MIYAVGTARSSACKGGLFMVDVSNPAKPVSPGCVSQDGYVHDAQCVVYDGPDSQYLGKEICFNYNEDTVSNQCIFQYHTTHISNSIIIKLILQISLPS